MPKKLISASISDDVNTSIRQMAVAENRSVSQMVDILLKSGLKVYGQKAMRRDKNQRHS